MTIEALVRYEAGRLSNPGQPCWDDLLQEGRIAAWLEGPNAVRWRMIDWLRAWSGRVGSSGHTPRELPVSLDVPAADGVDTSVGESLDDSGRLDPADVVVARDVVSRLSDRQRVVAMWCAAGWRGRDVARWWGVSEPRVSQVRSAARSSLDEGS